MSEAVTLLVPETTVSDAVTVVAPETTVSDPERTVSDAVTLVSETTVSEKPVADEVAESNVNVVVPSGTGEAVNVDSCAATTVAPARAAKSVVNCIAPFVRKAAEEGMVVNVKVAYTEMRTRSHLDHPTSYTRDAG